MKYVLTCALLVCSIVCAWDAHRVLADVPTEIKQTRLALLMQISDTRAALVSEVDETRGQLLAEVDKQAIGIRADATGQIASLRTDAMSRVDLLSAEVDNRLGQAITDADGKLGAALGEVAGIHADLKPALVNVAALAKDAQDSWDDSYWDIKASIESATVTANSVAHASEAIAAVTPRIADSVAGTTKNIDGITADVHKATTAFVKPEPWYERLESIFTDAALIGAKFF